MKVIMNKSNLVFNQAPTIVWERTGDYNIFKNSISNIQALGVCEYTRLMTQNVTFDLVKFNLVKAEEAMSVSYVILMTDYIREGSERNEFPELYSWKSQLGNIFTLVKEGTVNIPTTYKDIVIEVPEMTVPTGKEICVLLYGNGIKKLICPTGDDVHSDCNVCGMNNGTSIDQVGAWVSGSSSYANGIMPALTLMKKA